MTEEAIKRVEEVAQMAFKLHNTVSKESLLIQLAEECCELSQVALKIVRNLSGDNPSPVTQEWLAENFAEEVADVYNCLTPLSEMIDPEEVTRIQVLKMQRWLMRLGVDPNAKNDTVAPAVDPDLDPDETQRELFDDLMNERGDRP